MWKPNENGVNELISLFQDCNSPDNNKQNEIYNVKINLKIYFFNKIIENYNIFARERFYQLSRLYFHSF